MKYQYLLAFLVAFGANLSAQIPGAINYQGRLVNNNGEAVTGTVDFAIDIYDSETDGELLYHEDIGAIIVTNGLYSFEFGLSGESYGLTYNAVAVGNGSDNIFKLESPAIAVSDSPRVFLDGDEVPEGSFTVVKNAENKITTIVFLDEIPKSGQNVQVEGESTSVGIQNCLQANTSKYLQLKINGLAQVIRERVLAVPYALHSAYAERAKSAIYAEDISPALRADLKYLENLTLNVLSKSLGFDYGMQGKADDDVLILGFANAKESSSAVFADGVQYLHAKITTNNLNMDQFIGSYVRFFEMSWWIGGNPGCRVGGALEIRYEDGTVENLPFGGGPQATVKVFPTNPEKVITSVTVSARSGCGITQPNFTAWLNAPVSISLANAEFFEAGKEYRAYISYASSSVDGTGNIVLKNSGGEEFLINEEWGLLDFIDPVSLNFKFIPGIYNTDPNQRNILKNIIVLKR